MGWSTAGEIGPVSTGQMPPANCNSYSWPDYSISQAIRTLTEEIKALKREVAGLRAQLDIESRPDVLKLVSQARLQLQMLEHDLQDFAAPDVKRDPIE